MRLLIEYVLVGAAGAATRLLIHIYNYGLTKIKEKPERYIAHLPLGAVAGGIVHYLVTTLGWSNHLTSFFAGYFAPSFLQHLAKKKEWSE